MPAYVGLAASSAAGLATAFASVITALSLLVGAVTILLPQLRKLNRQSVEQSNQLRVIHTLVNSTLTASMQAELDSSVREVAVMTEVIGLREGAGLTVMPETLAALATARQRIVELTLALADRREQASALAAQVPAT